MKIPYCHICKCEKVENINMHFYTYYKCKKCSHIFNNLDKNAIKSNFKKYIKKQRNIKNEIVQDAFTSDYFNGLKLRDDFKEQIFLPLIKGKTILDTSSETGNFVKNLNDKGFYAYGIDDNRVFEPYWEDDESFQVNTIQSIKKYKRFDTILLPFNLSYSYCPYSLILDCYTRLNTGGTILLTVPVDNNPKKIYMARSQEFSSKSIWIFSKECNSKSIIRIEKDIATVIIPG